MPFNFDGGSQFRPRSILGGERILIPLHEHQAGSRLAVPDMYYQ